MADEYKVTNDTIRHAGKGRETPRLLQTVLTDACIRQVNPMELR